MGEEEVIKRRGLMKKHAAVDHEVWLWKTNLEKSRGTQRITKTEVQAFAIEAYKRVGISTFKASDGWYRRWKVRWQQPNVVCTKKVREEGGNSKTLVQNEFTTNNQQIFQEKEIMDCQKSSTNGTGHSNSEQNVASNFIDEPDTTLISKSESYLDSILSNINKETFGDELKSNLHTKTFLGLNRVQNTQSAENKPLTPESDSVLQTNARVRKKQNVFKRLLKKCKSDNNLSTKFPADEILGINVMGCFLNTKNNLATELIPKNSLMTESKTSEPNESNCLSENVTFVSQSSPTGQRVETLFENKNPNTFLSDDSFVDDRKLNLPEKTNGCSQSDSGTSFPSKSLTIETCYSFTSPLFDQNSSDFADHEVFCDSCEDFHPWNKSSQSCSCKPKDIKDNSLLSCVIQKKDFSSSNSSSFKNKPSEKITKQICTVTEPEEVKLKNVNLLLPKGKRYLVQFKSKVVNYALNHNGKLAADKFKVNRGTVSEWLTERKRFSGVGPLTSSTLEEDQSSVGSEFLSWLEESKFNLTNELITQKCSEWLLIHGGSSRCQWLRMYAQRLNGLKDSSSQKRYITYPEAFKRVVVFHAQTHSVKAAASVFEVSRRRIAEWQASGDKREKADGEETVSATCRNVTDEAVDRKIFEWYCSQENPPTSSQIRSKALELYHMAGQLSIVCGPTWYYRWRARHKLGPARGLLYSDARLLGWLLARLDNNQTVTHSSLAAYAVSLGHRNISRGWTFRFCRYHHKLLGALPESATPLPATLEQQVDNYRRELCAKVVSQGITPASIVAMDEVPLHFHPKDDSKRRLLVRRPGFDSCQASLLVSCLSDGTLLPTLFVFKGVGPTGKGDQRVVSTVSDSGLVTTDVLDQWLHLVCFPHLSEAGGVLVMDSFEPHTSPELQQTLSERQVCSSVIPPGCAFKLLPLLNLCHLFKSMLEEMCRVSLASQTVALQSPTPDQLYTWALQVHRHLAKHQKENVKAAFKEMLFQPLDLVPSTGLM